MPKTVSPIHCPTRWFLSISVLFLLWALFVAVSVALCGDGFLHAEANRYVPHYLTARPFVSLVFDSDATEGCLRARELSHVFDYLDSRFIGWCVQHGHPLLFSASHYGFYLAAGLAFWCLCKQHFGLSDVASIGLILLLWTSPSAMLYSSFFRSAKTGVLLMVFVSAAVGCWAIQRQGVLLKATFALCLLGLAWFDEQGLFLCGCAVLALGWRALNGRGIDKALLGWGAGAFLLGVIWREVGSSAATHFIVGENVDASYVRLPFADVVAHPAILAKIIASSPLLTLDAFRFAFGNLPVGLALAAVWGAYFFLQRASSYHSTLKNAHLAFAGIVSLLVLMYFLMLVRADYLVSSEHRRFLYCEPSTAVWLVAIAFAVGQLQAENPSLKRVIEIGLALLVVSNLFALQEHRFVLNHGYYAFGRSRATELKHLLQPEALKASDAKPADLRAKFWAAMAKPADFGGPLQESAMYLYFLSQAKGVTL